MLPGSDFSTLWNKTLISRARRPFPSVITGATWHAAAASAEDSAPLPRAVWALSFGLHATHVSPNYSALRREGGLWGSALFWAFSETDDFTPETLFCV